MQLPVHSRRNPDWRATDNGADAARMRLAQLLHDQDGVVARRQVLAAGHDDTFIEGMLRRREWVRVHPGVYLDHTGRPSWEQRAWAAVLHYWPAALCHASALGPPPPPPRVPGVAPEDLEAPVHVAIAHPRSAVAVPGVRLHRLRGLDGRVVWTAGPPRVRFEEALLDEAAGARSWVDALALVTDACQQRRTTPGRVRAALLARPRLRHRTWLLRVLDDSDAGALSVLEQAYLRRVERAHGLPAGRRQRRSVTPTGVVFRDVEYEQRVVVELDGRVGHERFRDRDRDRERDLLAATDGLMTLRVGWRQVHDEPCLTAARLAVVLGRRGWCGQPRACSPGCPVSRQRV